ncbi:ABC transporter ATP-binding protein [Oceanirhabdus sp. W0125-5]|uniref:ABC transporter ATP-binding protein n=1 Tax=Oceanirhabdus sp. W0125-5 TaxID=2999116 RepID=UPI0022F2C846|nr:ABC transporter ATP-binding protein [Oceanirhabdus sp. W0125-5]WBW95738.1 ABC transporter ATP-binding protein [Oceanirhabdus sp. W0125-5]
MSKILEVKNITKDYGKFKLDDVSFSLDRGYVMGFIGPNGAGKSTTIKMIMNLIRRNSGEIKIFEKDNIKSEKEIKEKIGFVYDESFYYQELSIKDNAKIISRFYRNWDNAKYRELLDRFNLTEKKKIKELSKGMKMKFSLAMALSHNAELLIMDEPTSGLDPVFRNEILELLYDEIQDEKKSVFFSTHITSDLEKIADYITFINNGKLVFSKEKDEIMESYSLVRGGKDILNSSLKNDFISIKENSFGFEGLTTKSREIQRTFKEKVVIEKASLEDIMLYTIGGEKSA